MRAFGSWRRAAQDIGEEIAAAKVRAEAEAARADDSVVRKAMAWWEANEEEAAATRLQAARQGGSVRREVRAAQTRRPSPTVEVEADAPQWLREAALTCGGSGPMALKARCAGQCPLLIHCRHPRLLKGRPRHLSQF